MPKQAWLAWRDWMSGLARPTSLVLGTFYLLIHFIHMDIYQKMINLFGPSHNNATLALTIPYSQRPRVALPQSSRTVPGMGRNRYSISPMRWRTLSGSNAHLAISCLCEAASNCEWGSPPLRVQTKHWQYQDSSGRLWWFSKIFVMGESFWAQDTVKFRQPLPGYSPIGYTYTPLSSSLIGCINDRFSAIRFLIFNSNPFHFICLYS